MKNVKTIVLFAFVAMSQVTVAQKALDTLRYVDRVWSLKKKAAILGQMELTEAEKSSFWPVYESYSNASRFLELEYLMMASRLARPNVSASETEDLSTRMLHNDLQLAKIRKQYYKKFKRALSSKQAAKFYQIDNAFRAMLRLEAEMNSLSSSHLAEVMVSSRK